jgi:glycosyltransferase involved in cell wall biosynthesis
MRLGDCLESMQVPHRNDISIVEQKDPTLKGRVVPIENGVSIERFDRKKMSETNMDALKKEMQLDGYQVIGTVGNIRPEKNQKLLISVLHELKKYNDNVKLVIVGDILVNDEYFSLKETIDKLSLSDSVIFTGFQFDVRPYIHLFDIYLLTSVGTESCPNAVLEAMSMEKPIVATSNVGLDGLIEEGVNGYVVNNDNALEMSHHLKNLLMSSNIMRRFGAASRLIVQSKYHLDKMISNYETWYEAVLSKKLIGNKRQSIEDILNSSKKI